LRIRAVLRLLLPLLLAGSGAVPPVRAAEDLAALRAKVRAAYGGDAAAELRGFRARGRILQMASGVGGQVELAVAVDGSLRSEARYPDRTEVRILQGPLVWSGGAGRQPFAPRDAADAIRLEFHRLAAPFELIAAPEGELLADGSTEEGWTRVARRWDDRARTVYEIDADGRIRRIRGEIAAADGQLRRFDSEAHDFREVSGVLFPFRTTTIDGGQIIAEIVLERVTLVREFGAKDFRPADAAGDI
jgi:hypothetical protein